MYISPRSLFSCLSHVLSSLNLSRSLAHSLSLMVSASMDLHRVSISLALPLSLLRRPRVEPPGISEDLAKR